MISDSDIQGPCQRIQYVLSVVMNTEREKGPMPHFNSFIGVKVCACKQMHVQKY